MPRPAWAFRALSRRPLASVLLVVSLALGIATAAATFGVVDAVLSRPLPYDDEEELRFLFGSVPEKGIPRLLLSPQNLADLEHLVRSFESVSAVSQARPLLLASDPPRMVRAEFVSADHFATLGLRPRLGRDFDSGGESDAIALVSSAFWARHFARSEDLADATLVLDETPFEVVGVLPPAYRGMLWDEIDVFLPLEAASRLLGPGYLEDRSLGWLTGIARLAPGATDEQVTRELADVMQRLELEHPAANEGLRAVTVPLRRLYFGEDLERALLYLLLGAISMLVLCALNAASLVASEAIARRRELVMLLAMGAERRDVFGLFVFPLALEVVLAGALGALLARSGARWLVGLSEVPPASFTEQYVDAKVLVIALVLSLALALVLALVPLVIVRRGRLAAEIRETTRSSRAQLRLRSALVVVEVALASSLLVGAGLMLQSVRAVLVADPGFPVDGLTSLQLALQTDRYVEPGERRLFVERILGALAGDPAIRSSAVAGPDSPPDASILTRLAPDERRGTERDAFQAYRSAVSPRYRETLGMPLLAGRDLGAGDRADAPPVALVSRSLARLLGAGGDLQEVLGARFRLLPQLDGDPPDAVWTVVGIVGDVRGRGFGGDGTAEHDVYLPFEQAPSRRFHLLVRSAGDRAAAARRIRETAAGVDPHLATGEIATLRQRFAEGAADQRFGSVLVGSLALLAIALTAVGFYGLFHLTVRSREQELGVRLSLGATPRSLLWMILRHGFLLASLGLLVGIGASLLLHRWIASFLYGTRATDPLVLGAALAILAMVALAGVLGPALRAMRIDPGRTLGRVE